MNFLKPSFESMTERNQPYFLPGVWEHQSFEFKGIAYISLVSSECTKGYVAVAPPMLSYSASVIIADNLPLDVLRACELWRNTEYRNSVTILDFLNATLGDSNAL